MESIANIINPYSSENEFNFINNSVLKSLFSKPYPIDIRNPRIGSINLSHYFQFDDPPIFFKQGEVINRGTISARENYYHLRETKINEVFTCLSNFLLRFNIPHIEISMIVCNYQSNEIQVIRIAYPECKKYLSINEEEKTILIFLEDKSFYEKLLEYRFGPGGKIYGNDNLAIEFSFSSFWEIILC